MELLSMVMNEMPTWLPIAVSIVAVGVMCGYMLLSWIAHRFNKGMKEVAEK
jgi:hypothetical protein